MAVALRETASPSVHDVVSLAKTSRNTFYVHFRDVPHAIEAVVSQVIDALNRHVDVHFADARTPLEAIRGLLAAWTHALGEAIDVSQAAFRVAAADKRGGVSRIASALRQHLRRATAEARRHGALSTPVDELRTTAMAAAAESLLGWYLDHPDSRDDVRELGADLLVRAFR
jgi:AcrR family transcriptional regulator